jgi:hypothetical protein
VGAIGFFLISVCAVLITLALELALELGSKTTSTDDDGSRDLNNTVDNSKAGAPSTSTLKSGKGATSCDAADAALDTSGSRA